MQITIQASGRRIRLTQSEVKILKSAAYIVTELQKIQAYEGATVIGVLSRVDDKGNYSESEAEKTSA